MNGKRIGEILVYGIFIIVDAESFWPQHNFFAFAFFVAGTIGILLIDGKFSKTQIISITVIASILAGAYIMFATSSAVVRPYIGLGKIGIAYAPTNFPYEQTTSMRYEFEITNTGTVPGSRVRGGWDSYINSAHVPNTSTPPGSDPAEFNPGQTVLLKGSVWGNTWEGVKNGSLVYVIDIWTDYYGPDGSHFNECQTVRYHPPSQHFQNLGPICDQFVFKRDLRANPEPLPP